MRRQRQLPDLSLQSALAKKRNDSAMGYHHHRNNPTSAYKSRWCRSEGTVGMPAKKGDFTCTVVVAAYTGFQRRTKCWWFSESIRGFWLLPSCGGLSTPTRFSRHLPWFPRVCKHNHSPLLLVVASMQTRRSIAWSRWRKHKCQACCTCGSHLWLVN